MPENFKSAEEATLIIPEKEREEEEERRRQQFLEVEAEGSLAPPEKPDGWAPYPHGKP